MKSILVFASTILLTAIAALGAGGILPGTGTPADPYLIEDFNDFDVFADSVNSATYWASGVYTKLMCDPNLAGRTYGWRVIHDFFGIFDGNGHTINNLTIYTTRKNMFWLGLFGTLKDSAAEVKNLGVVNFDITGGRYAEEIGGLCGNNKGSITNCFATGKIKGKKKIGNLCGVNEGTIADCYALGVIDGNDILGGLCGFNNGGTITDCYATVSVTGKDDTDYTSDIGGLCGYNVDARIINSHATGSVTGMQKSYELGGLCGTNYATQIINCYATGSVVGGDDSEKIGGLCGFIMESYIANCYATGSVNSGSSSSTLSELNHWIQFSQFNSGIGGCESPIDSRFGLIS